MNNNMAVVLAGGRGKRMDILCYTRPKPGLPFAGGYKIIDFTLSNCIYSGVDNVAILISLSCVIRWRVENSILSPRVWIDEQAVVTNSVITGNSIIGYHSIVNRSVLNEGVNVGTHCYIGFGSALVSGDWDVTILGKGVKIPPRTAIGRNCKILPNADLTDFITSAVPADAVVAAKPQRTVPL